MLSYWDEQWKPVPDFEWGYYVSDFGRVKGPRKILKGVDNGQGYLMVRLYKRRSTKPHHWLVHRLVALAFLEPPSPDAVEVHHKDGNPANNHIDNLEWVKSSAHSRAGVRKQQETVRLIAHKLTKTERDDMKQDIPHYPVSERYMRMMGDRRNHPQCQEHGCRLKRLLWPSGEFTAYCHRHATIEEVERWRGAWAPKLLAGTAFDLSETQDLLKHRAPVTTRVYKK